MMKKSILILLLGIVSVVQANAQADCIFEYCYIGSVSTNKKTIKDNNIIVLLPSPEFMLNIVDEERGFNRTEINNQLKYEHTSGTIESSTFCGTSDEIIEKIFKKNQKFYVIYVIKGKRKYESKINIRNIQFSHKNGVIYITLPQIRI